MCCRCSSLLHTTLLLLLSCLTQGGMYELLIDVLSLQQSASHDVVVVVELSDSRWNV